MEALFGQGLHPHPEHLAPGALEGEVPAVRLGRRFIRPTYDNDDDQGHDHDQEPGESEAVVRTKTAGRGRHGGGR